MCVIVCKPSGIDMPSEDTLRKCFIHNSDGAGYMFQVGDKVRIKKGFMKFKDFYDSVMQDYNKCGDKRTFVMHFRIGTLGSRSAGLTHPYPISKDLDELKKTEIDTNIGMAHNGVLSLTSKTYKEDKNDTMAFITDYLALFIKKREDLEDEDKIQLTKNLMGTSNKFAFLTNGKLLLIGDFTEDKTTGCYFSNMYWNTSYYNYSSYNNYRDYRDYYNSYYDDDDYYYGGGYVNKISEKKEEKKEEEAATTPLNNQVTMDDLEAMEEYYESCYDPVSKKFAFVGGDCPFEYEGRVDYCDRKLCGYFGRCNLSKQNNKLRLRDEREIRRQERKVRRLAKRGKLKNVKR